MAEAPQRQVFSDESYAPEQQKKFKEALARGDYREAQAILHQLPFPRRIAECTVTRDAKENIESNRKYLQLIIEGHSAIQRELDEEFGSQIFKE